MSAQEARTLNAVRGILRARIAKVIGACQISLAEPRLLRGRDRERLGIEGVAPRGYIVYYNARVLLKGQNGQQAICFSGTIASELVLFEIGGVSRGK